MNRPKLKGGADWSDADYIAYWKSRCTVLENGCWEWHGFRYRSRKSRSWYGSTSYRGRKGIAHRLMYRAARGAIPVGKVVMHLCDYSLCMNPEHLKCGTTQENLKDAAAKGSYRYHHSHYRFCKHGHEFTPENTHVCSRGFRQCRECARLRARTEEYMTSARERQRKNRAKRRELRIGDAP